MDWVLSHWELDNYPDTDQLQRQFKGMVRDLHPDHGPPHGSQNYAKTSYLRHQAFQIMYQLFDKAMNILRSNRLHIIGDNLFGPLGVWL